VGQDGAGDGAGLAGAGLDGAGLAGGGLEGAGLAGGGLEGAGLAAAAAARTWGDCNGRERTGVA